MTDEAGTEEISNLTQTTGHVQVILRSRYKWWIEERMARHNERVKPEVLHWIFHRTPSRTWTAITHGPAYLWSVVPSTCNEAAWEVENDPE